MSLWSPGFVISVPANAEVAVNSSTAIANFIVGSCTGEALLEQVFLLQVVNIGLAAMRAIGPSFVA